MSEQSGNRGEDLVGMEINITRTFDAPRELVFQAWTDPHHLAQWFGPRHFNNPVCEVDARPGGRLLVHMQGPDGDVHPTHGVFHEVVEPERLVLTTTAFNDAAGNPHLEVRHTVTFEEAGGKTTMTLHSVVVRATPEMAGPLSGMEQGWNESLDKLAEYLAAL